MKLAKTTVLFFSSALLGLSLSSMAVAETTTAVEATTAAEARQQARVAERRAARVEERRATRVAERRDTRIAERRGESSASVPELDAAGAPIALALIGGIAGIAMERRRKKLKA